MVPSGTSATLAERPATGGCDEDWRRADVIVGGFPCQDISLAGAGAGITGPRSSLWRWLCGAIRMVRPRYAIVENVAALLGRGMGDVVGDLAEIGYDSEWNCIPASHVGAPHRRDRIWIAAYPDGSRSGEGRQGRPAGLGEGLREQALPEALADARSIGGRRGDGEHEERRAIAGDGRQDVADPNQPRLQGWLRESLRECASERTAWESGAPMADPESTERRRRELHDGSSQDTGQPEGLQGQDRGSRCLADSIREWLVEPDVGRVADGVPARVDRLKGLGNAVVPQIPEIIGRAILEAEGIDVKRSTPPLSRT
jgi:DNA (cytosine-5)-methyltransferase 1